MRTILLTIQEQTDRDLVRTALKIFPQLRAVDIPRERLIDLLEADHAIDALILDLERTRGTFDPFIAEVRSVDREIPILALAERPDRAHFTKSKMELEIFSFIPLPIEPFDLLRRLHRLIEALPQRN